MTLLNPGKVPVIAADQPIYAVAKLVQWHWLETYGEDKFVIMFAGLHIEMAELMSIGTLSGWTGALLEAGIASPGTAVFFLTASNITRTRQMQAAHMDYSKKTDDHPEEVLSFEAWCEQRKLQSRQLHFWYMLLLMELVILLILIQSFREANFFLYCHWLS